MEYLLFQEKENVKYPKVNYIGNKEKISKWIVQKFPVKKGRVLDMFSGGNSLSFELKKQGFQVISNDALYASYVVGKALIENSNVKLDITHIDKALQYDISEKDRLEFSWLDNFLYFPEEVDELSKLVKYSNLLDSYEKYLFQALVRRAMIRKLPYSRMNVPWNNIIKLRDEEYSYEKYGRKRAYHNESFSFHMKENIEAYNLSVFDNTFENKVYQKDALEVLETLDYVDVIYMDPPYPSTMNKYDDFYGSFDKVFGKKINHINLTDKKIFLNNLELIIQTAINKTRYIVLSLNSNSIPGVQEIKTMFSKYGTVRVEKRQHNYQVSSKENKTNNFEILAILDLS